MDRKIGHDLLNELERLKIMYQLLSEERFEKISKEEIIQDALVSIEKLKELFTSIDQ